MRKIGLDVEFPKEKCESVNCPFHGTLKIRGKTMKGKVVSLDPENTAIIERRYLKFVSKYERYERRKKKLSVHKPKCIKLKEGDVVMVAECRPVSKTKRHVVIKKV
ncbi:MAG: 30S ribosomal protein S17 [Candidatus Aenigmarchaeota archaeon]|nr:30S ribosomal protein S17 [Candidatus Aenigmarchaeota archaeon]